MIRKEARKRWRRKMTAKKKGQTKNEREKNVEQPKSS